MDGPPEQAKRRIMDGLGQTSRLPLLGIEEGDIGVLLGGPLLGVFIASLLGLDMLILPLALCGLTLGAMIVYAAPQHLDAWYWFRTVSHHVVFRPKRTLAGAVDSDEPTTEGGFVERLPITVDERTQDLTQIHRAWFGSNAVERTDGSIQGFIELHPETMDFAQSGDWAAVQETAATFANTEADYPLRLYVTTREFDVEPMVAQLEERLNDPHLETRPRIRRLIEEYREERPKALKDTQELHYYLGTEVDRFDVLARGRREPTPGQKLASIPLLGLLFTPFVTHRTTGEGFDTEQRMADLLDRRLQLIETEFVNQLPGWSATRCETLDMVGLATQFWNGDSVDEIEYDADSPNHQEASVESVEERDGEDQPDELLRSLVAPSEVEWETRAARVGDEWTATMYIAGYPDYPSDALLSKLFEKSSLNYDLSIHLEPKRQRNAENTLRNTAERLRADADIERTVRGRYLHERAEEAAATYNAVERGQRVFSLATYLTVRAENREKLEKTVENMQSALRGYPADCSPKLAICEQHKGLQSVAPFGTDQLRHDVVALGGAVGAFLSSLHNPTVLEAGGIEVGTHSKTGTPVVVDPFAREDGYAMFTVGDPGSGKSFSAKQQFIRSLEQDPDRIGVILEPLNNWRGVADALGASRITVGGTRGLNPLEIKPTPEHELERRGNDASPLRERCNRAIGFFVNYFALRNVDLGDSRTTLERVFDEAYAQAGITEDVRTHSRESPTVRDVLDILEEMSEDASAWVVRNSAEAEKLEEDALWLLDQLRAFDSGGQFENLGRASEFDIRDESVVYLDLVQQGGSLGGETSLLMELLISLVYEHAKQSEKEVVFVIDEARYLFQNKSTAEYLETIFRHHRHHDLSIRLITQTVDEFFAHPETETILDQCSVKQFNKLDGMDERWAKEFGMNSAEMRFVQNAVPGSDEKGHSEALIGVDGQWRGVKVRALDFERSTIDSRS
ncbi:VirB4 family type IV secretion system protein [Halomarina rubra]|uniref:VirB4 family type IV secretion system protein n=1 Tax=Halomarina rubra TaxID=2071873 RepID=A0ABD6AWH1_9EURY|nr:hypothetical protein [Halomarina rubra]